MKKIHNKLFLREKILESWIYTLKEQNFARVKFSDLANFRPFSEM